MVDTIPTNVPNDDPMLITKTETISTSFTPLDIHRHDSQIEINNYYINYIDDQSDLKTLKINEGVRSMSIIEKNSCQLEISQLLEEVIMF
jgi:hypothetical protein